MIEKYDWGLAVTLVSVALVILATVATLLGETLFPDAVPASRLNLLVIDVTPPYEPYADFCRRYPKDCELDGPSLITMSTEIRATVERINKAVNRDIRFTTDLAQYNEEEYWNYPVSGRGDCEDMALLKRKRLFESGIPRGAMRLALAYHRVLSSAHCVLTLETTDGTFILDNLTDAVQLWHETAYNFEARERADGQWERFDQGIWSYGS